MQYVKYYTTSEKELIGRGCLGLHDWMEAAQRESHSATQSVFPLWSRKGEAIINQEPSVLDLKNCYTPTGPEI